MALRALKTRFRRASTCNGEFSAQRQLSASVLENRDFSLCYQPKKRHQFLWKGFFPVFVTLCAEIQKFPVQKFRILCAQIQILCTEIQGFLKSVHYRYIHFSFLPLPFSFFSSCLAPTCILLRPSPSILLPPSDLPFLLSSSMTILL